MVVFVDIVCIAGIFAYFWYFGYFLVLGVFV